jgi:hypothetical protein
MLIVTGLKSREVKSLLIRGLSEVSLQERADGSGSMLFGSSNPAYAMWFGTSWPGLSGRMPPAFERFENVRKIYGLLKETQRHAS